jgi:uncharacterized membrane protein
MGEAIFRPVFVLFFLLSVALDGFIDWSIHLPVACIIIYCLLLECIFGTERWGERNLANAAACSAALAAVYM